MFKEFDNDYTPTTRDREFIGNYGIERGPVNPDKKEKSKEKESKKKERSVEAKAPKVEKEPIKFNFFEDDKKAEPNARESLFGSDKTKEKAVDTDDIDEQETKELESNAEAPEQEEKLEDEEARLAALQVIEVREQEVTEEQAEASPGSLQAVAADANALLLHEMKQQLDETAEITEEAIDTAAENTTQQLDELLPDEVVNETPEAPEDLEPQILEQPDDDQELIIPISRPPVVPPVIPPGGGSSGGSGGGGGPTLPPPGAPGGPPVSPNSNTNGPAGPAGPNFNQGGNSNAPGGPASPNVLPVPPEAVVQHSRAGDMLLGGVLGYLLGRRRGRIKTEKRLLPVQEKLEHEVKDLHARIAAKELEVRTQAVRKAEAKRDDEARYEFAGKLQDKVAHLPERDKPTPRVSELLQAAEVKRAETLHKPKLETIGRVAVETADKTPEQVAKRVETMAMVDILPIAARIVVEGVTVRQMYEAGRLNPEGLRRVVAEYLSGGNVERKISKETLGEEHQHERSVERFRTDNSSDFPVNEVSTPLNHETIEIIDPVRKRLEEAQHPDSHTMLLPSVSNNHNKKSKPPVAMLTIVSVLAVVLVIAAILLVG